MMIEKNHAWRQLLDTLIPLSTAALLAGCGPNVGEGANEESANGGSANGGSANEDSANVDAVNATDGTGTAFAVTGNGAPSGAHFQLNIIGVSKNKTADLTNNDGRRIFVPLSGKTRINLSEGTFAVLDANGTDGSASFQLPNPDPDGDGKTSYTVFARALGIPGGSSKTTTCATDPTTGEVICSTTPVVLTRTSGRSRFTDVSNSLLFINADIDGDGDIDHVNLFSDALEGFFWEYDNNGLKLAQLRFFEVTR